MEYFKDLVIPMALSGGFSVFIFKLLLTDSNQSSSPQRITGPLSLNIFKGNNTVNINIDASSTPQDLSRLVFSSLEIESHSAIFVYNGRRLNNSLSLGEQNVRNGAFIHSQLTNFSTEVNSEENIHNQITIMVCLFLLVSTWILYFCYPGYFSFISKTILIGFSEILCFFIYYQVKTIM